MRNCFIYMVIYMVTYEGQTESAYTWTESDYSFAESLKVQLETQYPDRVWSIYEKDVS